MRDDLNKTDGWRRRVYQQWRRLARPTWLTGLNRTEPLSRIWGFDRGTPVDRYYIERFIETNRRDIRGRVLEVHDPRYTDRFGSGVEESDVLDIDSTNSRATIVADLSAADHVPANAFDCFVVTQTFQFIRDVQGAFVHSRRILRPGGVMLATVPAVSRLAPHYGVERDYWRFTPAGFRVLLESVFGRDRIELTSFGNVRTACAFLAGIAHEEVPRAVLDHHDAYFPVIVAARITKSGGGG